MPGLTISLLQFIYWFTLLSSVFVVLAIGKILRDHWFSATFDDDLEISYFIYKDIPPERIFSVDSSGEVNRNSNDGEIFIAPGIFVDAEEYFSYGGNLYVDQSPYNIADVTNFRTIITVDDSESHDMFRRTTS